MNRKMLRAYSMGVFYYIRSMNSMKYGRQVLVRLKS